MRPVAAEARPRWRASVDARLADVVRGAVVVGLVTAGPTPSAAGVVSAAREGLAAGCPDAPAGIVHADLTGSSDTALAIDEAAGPVPVVRLGPPDLEGASLQAGTLGRRAALHAIFAATARLEPRALVVLNPGLTSTTAAWSAGLAGPAASGACDLVLPLYRRRRFEGTLTQALVAPLLRALFGLRLGHPIAEELGCSRAGVQRLLEADWDSEPARAQVDIWLPATAAVAGLSVGQAALGPRAVAVAPAQEPLGATVGRVAGTIFGIAEQHDTAWLETRDRGPASGVPEPAREIDPGPAVDVARMVAGFHQGVRELFPLWERILAPDTLSEILALGEATAEDLRLSDRLWVHVVYDFLLAWRFRVAHRPHVARSLAPIYLGRTASVVRETRAASPAAAAAGAERLAEAFERERGYLVERWR